MSQKKAINLFIKFVVSSGFCLVKIFTFLHAKANFVGCAMDPLLLEVARPTIFRISSEQLLTSHTFINYGTALRAHPIFINFVRVLTLFVV